MNRLLGILLILTAWFPSMGQDILVPAGYDGPVAIQRTPFQKGVGVSTDILAVALPVGALTASAILQDWEGVKQAALSGVVAAGANFMLKYAVRELRPDHSNFHSFPSLHSTSAFVSAAYLQRRYGWKVGGPAYAVAAYVAAGRVMARKHHWWDCVAGAAIGVGSAYIFTTPWAKKHELSLLPVADETYVGLEASIKF